MSTGDRIDWGENGKVTRLGRKMSGSSFSSLLGRNKSPRSNKNNNKATGYVGRDGGSAGTKAAGLSGLHVTRVNRKLNLQKGENIYPVKSKIEGMNTRRNQSVTKGGGHPRRAIVQAKVAAVKVKPEC